MSDLIDSRRHELVIESQEWDCFDMPTNKEQFDAIDARLAKIEEELQIRSRPKGPWGRRIEWAINHKGTSLILTVILCVVSIVGGGYFKYWLDHKDDGWNSAVDVRIDKTLGAKGGIKETLASIEKTTEATENTLKTLSPFIQDLVRHEMDKRAALPKEEFQETLPELKSTIEAAQKENVSIPSRTVQGLQRNFLRADQGTRGYWPIAAEFISYVSSVSRSIPDSSKLPNCLDITVQPAGILFPGGKRSAVTVQPVVFHDCRMVMDFKWEELKGTEPSGNVPLYPFMDLPVDKFEGGAAVVFKNAVIVYRGGPIRVRVPMKFVDCVFDIQLANDPYPNGQLLVRSLLASVAGNASVPLKKEDPNPA